MSFIETQSETVLATISGNTEIVANAASTRTGSAVLAGATAIQAIGVSSFSPTVVFAGVTVLNATGRSGNDPTGFGAGVIAGATTVQAGGSVLIVGYVRFDGQTTIAAAGNATGAESATLRLIVDVLPVITSNNYQNYGARLKVDGNIIPIEVWDVDAADDGAGKTFSATIARFSDRSYFTANAAIKFELDFGDGFFTEFEGVLTEKNFNLSNDGDKPNDSFSFTAADTATNRLRKSPLRNTVAYDSARETISPEDFETIFDTAGRSYPLEAIGISGMKLFDLFQAIYVNRCGFSAVQTNLPNYPVRRADFNVSGSYHDGIKGSVGMFEPVVFSVGDVLWLADATNVLPSGFPAPRQLLASRIDGLQSSQSIEPVEGFALSANVADLGEYFTQRVDTETTTVGNIGDDGYTRTVKKTYVNEYRIASQPQVVIGEVTTKEQTQIFDNSSNVFPIDDTLVTYSYDAYGRQWKTTKTVKKDTPNLPGGTTSSLQTVRTEESKITYGVNPFFPQKQIQKKNEMIASGLIALDSEVQFLGKDFPQDFVDATRAGNLKDSTTLITGTLESIVETFQPLRNGQVKAKKVTTDFTPAAVGRKPIVSESPEQVRSGDVSLKGQSGGRQIKRYVFPTDDYTPTGKLIEDFAVADLPLEYAIPLARRRLLRKTSINQRLTANIIGLDRTIERGTILSVYNRETEVEAKLIVEGYKKHGDASKSYMIVRGRQV